eukprot:TRINITY_DN2434_c0_g2_i4.p1 TRINITY_DN2434_c0_g2~~TRINITY_DN2434_c0_g2_i4.p1  ORF type:complete len:338 (+),score=57.76 TRINITY_DN2434_c0_g2_i4:21-1034(+)
MEAVVSTQSTGVKKKKKNQLSMLVPTLYHTSLCRSSLLARSYHRYQPLPYDLRKGLQPLYSPEAANYMWMVVHKTALSKYHQTIQGTGHEIFSLEDNLARYRGASDFSRILNAGSALWNNEFMWGSICPGEYGPILTLVMSPFLVGFNPHIIFFLEFTSFPCDDEITFITTIFSFCNPLIFFFFFFSSLDTGGTPSSPWMRNYLEVYFGGMEKFEQKWINTCMSFYGSGWIWLIDQNGLLEIVKGPNSSCPLAIQGIHPIMTMSMWEHAYMMDYGMDREKYVRNFLKAVDWSAIEQRLRSVPRSTKIGLHWEYLMLMGPQDAKNPISPVPRWEFEDD